MDLISSLYLFDRQVTQRIFGYAVSTDLMFTCPFFFLVDHKPVKGVTVGDIGNATYIYT